MYIYPLDVRSNKSGLSRSLGEGGGVRMFFLFKLTNFLGNGLALAQEVSRGVAKAGDILVARPLGGALEPE